jgi:nuclear mRNA export protein PCID2/THP1
MVATNLILGRFPSRAFMSRPESAGVLEKFAPIAKAIRKGDIAAFKRSLGPEGGSERWFFQKGLLLPLLHRAEVLVWRSLARRVFLLTYQVPTDPNSRKAPTLDLTYLVTAAQYCQKILEGWYRSKDSVNHLFGELPDLVPPPNGPIQLSANQGTVFGNLQPDILEVEAIVASLVQQGLLHGFVSHKLSLFAILGAKQRGGALRAGFPPPWEVIKVRAESNGSTEVPGWVREERKVAMGGVVNLSGIARPVGSGA